MPGLRDLKEIVSPDMKENEFEVCTMESDETFDQEFDWKLDEYSRKYSEGSDDDSKDSTSTEGGERDMPEVVNYSTMPELIKDQSDVHRFYDSEEDSRVLLHMF